MGFEPRGEFKARINIELLKNADSSDGGFRQRALFDKFIHFVKSNTLTHDPTIDQLRAFAMDRIEGPPPLQTNTVLQYLSIIKKEGRKRDPSFIGTPSEEYEYCQMRTALKRLFASEDRRRSVARKKTPVLPEDIPALMKAAIRLDAANALTGSSSRHAKEIEDEATPPKRGKIIAAVVALLFGGLMRPSELLGNAQQRPRWKDVVISTDQRSASVKLITRKTALYDDNVQLTVFFSASFPGNPVKQLRLLQRDAMRMNRTALVPSDIHMGANSFPAILKKLVREAGIRRHITPHCFRHGGASFLADCQATPEEIMASGGWSSKKAMENYLHWIKRVDQRFVLEVQKDERIHRLDEALNQPGSEWSKVVHVHKSWSKQHHDKGLHPSHHQTASTHSTRSRSTQQRSKSTSHRSGDPGRRYGADVRAPLSLFASSTFCG